MTPDEMELAERCHTDSCDHIRELADEARLVAQWADAVDPMPDELRAELHDLGEHARVALAAPAASPEEE